MMVVQLCTSAKKPLNHTLELCPSTACCFLNRSISLDTTLGAATQLGQLPQAFPAPLRATWGGGGLSSRSRRFLPSRGLLLSFSLLSSLDPGSEDLPALLLAVPAAPTAGLLPFGEIPWKSRGSSCWGRVLPGAHL